MYEISVCDFENDYLAFKFQGKCSQPTQPPSTWTTPNTSCKYINLIFPSIFLQVAAPPHPSFNISTQKFPKLPYLLKLKVGPGGLCLLFFQTRLPRAMARMATGGPHFYH